MADAERIYQLTSEVMDIEQRILQILSRYGLRDRKVVVSKKGVAVFLPEGDRNESNEGLFDDISHVLNDSRGVTIMNVRNGMSAEEFVRKNRITLEKMGIMG